MRTKLAPSLLIALLGPGLDAQTTEPAPRSAESRPSADPTELAQQIRAELEDIRDDHHLPAIAACVLRDGDVLANIAIGRRRVDDATPVTTDDLWHLGSCTKAMTATMIARLVERGLLRFDSNIGELTKSHPAFALLHDDWREVTIDQLLRHRAGMPPNPPQATYESVRELDAAVHERRQRVIANVLAEPPAHPPGSREDYSNAGYMTAGVLAELVTGKAWETLMRDEVFTPLGMASAGFGPPGEAERVTQPFGHVGTGKQLEPMHHDNPAELGPAGTVHASLADWGKFVDAHRAGMRGTTSEPHYLKAASFAHLHDPSPNANYAAGFVVQGKAGARRLWHNGSNTMWYCECVVSEASGLVILIATNTANDAASSQALRGITRVLSASGR